MTYPYDAPVSQGLFDRATQLSIVAARVIEKRVAVFRRTFQNGLEKLVEFSFAIHRSYTFIDPITTAL